MLVCEFDFAIVKAQLKTEIEDDVFLTTKHYKIERSDVEADIEYLRDAEERFCEAIKNDTMPPLILPSI
jgi:phage host-nuclease inhibitor protein Gam